MIGGRTASARDAAMVGLLDRGFARGAPLVAEAPVPQAAGRKDASPEREVVVASLETTATDAIAAVPSARPNRKVRNETASAPSKRTSKSTKRVAADKPPTRRKSGSQAYGVQVGAFKAPTQARAAMKLAMQRAPDLLRGTFASVGSQRVGKSTLFKAVLVGLSRTMRRPPVGA